MRSGGTKPPSPPVHIFKTACPPPRGTDTAEFIKRGERIKICSAIAVTAAITTAPSGSSFSLSSSSDGAAAAAIPAVAAITTAAAIDSQALSGFFGSPLFFI